MCRNQCPDNSEITVRMFSKTVSVCVRNMHRVDYYNYKMVIKIIKTVYNMNFSKELVNYDISRDAMNEYLKNAS
jgi:hypothetical protein